MRRLTTLVVFIFLLHGFAFSQASRSNVYVFQLKIVRDSVFEFTKPQYLTFFNKDGYNNHPHFISNNKLFIATQLPFDRQPDLYELDLEKKTKTRITATPEGEYSPARMPDNYSFSAVRMEFSGRDTLIRLWQFPLDRVTNGQPVFKYLDNIGYYQWLNSQLVAVFLVGAPNRLAIVDTRTDQPEIIASNVGRCFRLLPNRHLAFVQKSPYGSWEILDFNPDSKTSVRIADTLPGSEDFAVLPNGTFLMGSGSKLYKFDRLTDAYWEEIADLRFYGITGITRLAVSNDLKIAVVSN